MKNIKIKSPRAIKFNSLIFLVSIQHKFEVCDISQEKKFYIMRQQKNNENIKIKYTSAFKLKFSSFSVS